MRFVLIVIFGLSVAGCAQNSVYNPPMQIEAPPEMSFNENSFKTVQEGMTLDQVHQIMGSELIIGYEFQSPDYKPLTIPNPYKTETIEGTDYFIEYYLECIRQPDGVVKDDELMPLIFKNGKLMGRGWTVVNSLRLNKPPA